MAGGAGGSETLPSAMPRCIRNGSLVIPGLRRDGDVILYLAAVGAMGQVLLQVPRADREGGSDNSSWTPCAKSTGARVSTGSASRATSPPAASSP